MSLTGKKPDQLEILIGNKTHFFSNLGCCNPKPEQFFSRTSNLPKEKEELFSQRDKLLLAPPGLNPKPLMRVNRKTFHDATASAGGVEGAGRGVSLVS